MKIAGRPIGLGHVPYIIAEMSGNHNQSLDRALQIVDAAAAAGAHALKDVEPARVPEPNPRSLLESMEQQFWVVGGDRIHLSIQGKTHVFGKQLALHEAQQLAKVFNQRLAKLQKKHSAPGD